MMAGVGVAKLLKNNKKKITIQIPQLKLLTTFYFTSSPQGQAYQAMSCPTLGHYILDVNSSTGSEEIALVVSKSIPSCNFSGKERKFQHVHICIRTVILKGVGSSTPVTSLRQVPVLVSSD